MKHYVITEGQWPQSVRASPSEESPAGVLHSRETSCIALPLYHSPSMSANIANVANAGEPTPSGLLSVGGREMSLECAFFPPQSPC